MKLRGCGWAQEAEVGPTGTVCEAAGSVLTLNVPVRRAAGAYQVVAGSRVVLGEEIP